MSDHTTAGLGDVAGLGCWSSGTALERIVVADWATHQIKFLLPDGGVAEIVGAGTPGTLNGSAGVAQFANPRGVTVIGQSVFVLHEAGAVRRLDRVAGVWQVTTLASGLSGPLYDLTSDGIDTLYFSAGGAANAGVYRLPLTGGPATRVFDDPTINFGWASIERLGSVGFVLAARANNRLHLLTPGDDPGLLTASPLAGTGEAGSVGGGAPAAAATITMPYGLAADLHARRALLNLCMITWISTVVGGAGVAPGMFGLVLTSPLHLSIGVMLFVVMLGIAITFMMARGGTGADGDAATARTRI